MFLARVLSWPYGRVAALYLAGFILLDWLSFIHPFAPFGITPWNPPTGLSFALILLFGQRYMPLLFVARCWPIFWFDTCRFRSMSRRR